MRKELHVCSTHLLDLRQYDLLPVKYGYGGEHKSKKQVRFVPYVPRWDYYVVHYVFSGKGWLFLDGAAIPVSAGQCFLICPGDNASYVGDKDDMWNAGWVGFRGEAAAHLRTLSSRVFSMPREVFAPLLHMEEANGAEDYLLLSMLYRMYAVLFAEPQSATGYAVEAERYIRAHFRESISVASLAARLGITPRYLTSLFKQKYGKTTQRHLMEVRLSYARGLLLEGSSVSATAAAVGYTDPFVFSRAFCRFFGVPPKDFIAKGEE